MMRHLLALAAVGCAAPETPNEDPVGSGVPPTPVTPTAPPSVPRFGVTPTSIREANEAWCWVTLDGELAVLGLDDHALYRSSFRFWGGLDMVYWEGSFYSLGTSGRLRQGDGAETSPVPDFAGGGISNAPRGVSTWGDHLAVLQMQSMVLYDTPEAVLAADGVQIPYLGTRTVERMAIEGDLAYTAHQRTSELHVFDVADGFDDSVVVLEGFDDWVHGIDVVGERIVIASVHDQLFVFDLEGNQLDVLAFDGQSPSGVWCETHE